MINRLKRTVTKTGRSAGQPMCIVTLEDLEGQIEATIFSEALAQITEKYPKAIGAEQIVFLRGKIDKRRETPGVIVNDVFPIADAMPRLTRSVRVQIDQIEGAAALLNQLKPILTKHKGNCQTALTVPAAGSKRATINLDPLAWSVRATAAMKEELEYALNGHGRVEFEGAGTLRSRRTSQPPLFEGAENPVQPADEVAEDPVMIEEI
jgi:DNA polymerase III subunit alpha